MLDARGQGLSTIPAARAPQQAPRLLHAPASSLVGFSTPASQLARVLKAHAEKQEGVAEA